MHLHTKYLITVVYPRQSAPCAAVLFAKKKTVDGRGLNSKSRDKGPVTVLIAEATEVMFASQKNHD